MNQIQIGNKTFYHPGYYLENMINNNSHPKREWADRFDLTEDELDKLFNGERDIDFELANKLYSYTGSPAAIWMNLQHTFDLARLMMEV